MSTVRTRTHTVAVAAYERVDAHSDESWKKQYGALAHKLPGMILQNGLAQATGFLLAKGNPEHRALLDDLSAVLRAADAIPAATADGRAVDGPALHGLIIGSGLTETMHLTRRSLEASAWIKRYVQGVLRVNATGEQAVEDETPAPRGSQGVKEDAAGDQIAEDAGKAHGDRS